MNVLPHPKRLQGLRDLETRLIAQMNEGIASAAHNIAAALAILREIAPRLDGATSADLLTRYQRVLEDLSRAVAAPTPVWADFEAICTQLERLADAMIPLAAGRAGSPAAGEQR
jgi:hypothetical protein